MRNCSGVGATFMPLLLQEPLQDRQPDFGVVDLEDALLDRQRQRQELGEAVADPRCIVERRARRETGADRRARPEARGAAPAAGTRRRAATRGSAASGEISPTTRPSGCIACERTSKRVPPAALTCRMPCSGMSQVSMRASVPIVANSGAAPPFGSTSVAARDQAHAERACRRAGRSSSSRCSAARRSAAADGRPETGPY